MFHVAVFGASVAQDATFSPLTASQDQAITIQNNRYIIGEAMRVLGAQVVGLAVTNARIESPQLRNPFYPYIHPVEPTAALGDLAPVVNMRDRGITIPQLDEFTVSVSHAGSGADQITAALFLTQNTRPAPGGSVFTARATAAITGTQNAWTAGNITFDQALPYGRYSVVGGYCQQTNPGYFRLIFPMQSLRPGFVATSGTANITWDYPRYGGWGEWGVFNSTAQPQLEVYSLGGAGSAQTLFLDLIKTG